MIESVVALIMFIIADFFEQANTEYEGSQDEAIDMKAAVIAALSAAG